MYEQQDSGRPRPATKPPFLSARSLSNVPSSSSNALRGATSAFSPKSATSSVSITPTSIGARFAAAAAAANGQAQRGRVTVVEGNGTKPLEQRSPSRGRPPNSYSQQVAGARSAASVSGSPAGRSLQSHQSPSAIAARLASASPSPTRSTKAPSPLRRNPAWTGINGEQAFQPDSSSEVKSEFKSGRSISPRLQEQPAPSVRTRMLSFEKIPTLKPQGSALPREPVKPDTGPSAARRAFAAAAATTPASSTPTTFSVPSALSRALSNPGHEGIHLHSPNQVPTTAGRSSGSPNTRPVQSKAPPPLPAPRRGAPSKPASPPDRSQEIPVQDIRTGMTVSSLADAMVASSLASRRTPSPMKQLSSSPRLRHSASASDLRHQVSQPTTIRPQLHKRHSRPMKQTLRKNSSDNEEDEVELTKRGRRHLVRKHPNMHHEGDRKRWRDRITELERKRYEGVFAANRGLLLGNGRFEPSASSVIDPSSEGNQVVNVVVRDIWERSRLPKLVLMEIYDLVAPEEPLYLNREQFVVGLWLIDQSLKGRKLPVKVSASVWNSVRHSQGIKIRNRPL